MIIQVEKYLDDDDFVKTLEFKIFLYKVKQSELTLMIKMGESEKKKMRLLKTFWLMTLTVKL